MISETLQKEILLSCWSLGGSPTSSMSPSVAITATVTVTASELWELVLQHPILARMIYILYLTNSIKPVVRSFVRQNHRWARKALQPFAGARRNFLVISSYLYSRCIFLNMPVNDEHNCHDVVCNINQTSSWSDWKLRLIVTEASTWSQTKIFSYPNINIAETGIVDNRTY